MIPSAHRERVRRPEVDALAAGGELLELEPLARARFLPDPVIAHRAVPFADQTGSQRRFGSLLRPEGDGDVAGDAQIGGVSDCDLIVSSVEIQRADHRSGCPGRTVEQRAVMTVSRAVRREGPAGFIQLPPADQTVIAGP